MQAPDSREPIPLRYLRVRASVIPLAPHDKQPYFELLEGGTWAPYQQRRASDGEVLGWLAHGHDHNWGVVCGQVSDGLYCGDVDDLDFAQWVLDHARDPLLRGACVVESGSGKAHIWFRSPNKLLSARWKLPRGKTVGDIRGDGNGNAGPSYMVVPPSIHPDTGDKYRFVAHSFSDLPSIENGEAFLADVLRAYLNNDPFVEPPQVASNSKEVLQLDDDEKTSVLNKIRALNLKGKFRDALLVAGNQDPGTRHWQSASSRSEIDFAVVCELLRRGLDFDQIERIFAASYIGANGYRDAGRANHGYGYLKLTYDNALREINAQQQASQAAIGQNFEVKEVIRERFDWQTSYFLLTADCQNADGSVRHGVQVRIPDDDLMEMKRFQKAFFKRTQFMPEFRANQLGNRFGSTFGQAVANMAKEVVQAPEAATRLGPAVGRLRDLMRRLPKEEPRDRGDMRELGWQVNGVFYLNANEVTYELRRDDRALGNDDTLPALDMLGTYYRITRQWPDGATTEILVLTPYARRA